ncbi:MAG: TonB-dependent receptor plug domain-containing protein, partial [Chitinophagales bacterium]
VESIQISKGPGSVVNGYEGISGSINTELKKPYATDKEKFFINLYGSNSGRYEGNLNIAHKFNEKLSTILFTHTSIAQKKLDHNHDNFLDMPLSENYIFMNRWNYSSGNIHEAQAGIKMVFSDLQGGQTIFDPDKAHTIENGYGVGIDTRRVEGFLKNGFVFLRPNTSIGIVLDGSYHQQKSFFGLDNYDAEEHFVHLNIIGQTFLFNTNHTIKGGASVLNNNLDETYQSVHYTRNEVVPGIFAEYNYNVNDKFNLLAGYRVDFHNLYGTFTSPRVHVKYTFTPNTTLRASAGKAYRVADVLAENTSILTSARQFVVEENLLPEQAWNYGLTFIQSFETYSRRGIITLDIYRTDFINQVVIDVDKDAHGIYVRNLNGVSFSNVMQT